MMNKPTARTVAIVGASNKKERYAHSAQELLMEKGFPVIPISKKTTEILGVKTLPNLENIETPIDTVTLYVGPLHQQEIIRQIIQLKPKHVIFNPGTENPQAYGELELANIDYEEACTLVLLRTGQF